MNRNVLTQGHQGAKAQRRRRNGKDIFQFFGVKFNVFAPLRPGVLMLLFIISSFGQAPTVEKIEPPNWWANYSINPVRVLVRGQNLSGANVLAPQNSGLKTSNVKISANGHYLFFDLTIAPNAIVGKYKIILAAQKSLTSFDFEISPKINRNGRFQGYTPDDVIYFLMPDRFADGDP